MNRSKKTIQVTSRLVIVLTVVAFISLSCRLRQADTGIVKQELKLDVEIKGANGDTGHMVFWAKLFYVGNYTIIAVPSQNEYSNVAMNKEGEVLSDKLFKTDTTFTYHVFENKQKTGVKYKGLDSLIGYKFNVDSLLTLYARPNFPYFENDKDILVGKKKVNGSAVEIYRPIKKKDASYPDSTYIYFNSKLSSKGYIFSSYLDSARNSRVSKVIYIYNPTDGKVETGKTMTFELNEYDVPEAPQINALIKRYNIHFKSINKTGK